MAAFVFSLLLSLVPAIPPDGSGLASRYADTAADEGGTPACARRIKDPSVYRHRCAHRDLPCGTVLLLRTATRWGWCVRLDAGPWGAIGPHGERANPARLRKGWKRRGVLDLSPVPANGLGLKDGRVMVDYWILSTPRPRH